MTKKEAFIKYVKESGIFDVELEDDLVINAKLYFDVMQGTGDTEKSKFTSIGRQVLTFMRENKETYNNLFTCKAMSEGLSIASRSISGGCRKLVNDGYLEKMGENPVVYSLTEAGETTELDNEEKI